MAHHCHDTGLFCVNYLIQCAWRIVFVITGGWNKKSLAVNDYFITL